ncbi:hypothetical protein GALMADRAFT_160427 [Galerina marginata CBS 339.88]|uniref:Uncharacterized protein n=1 Tax=Galerina marginata (strain CBS 339.88) TaxID=685588 RepID=A0A067SRH4_GALM3|nr:hypothetical protein GALMADRAFT_160427 [Galerina marginata CBS 339.88]
MATYRPGSYSSLNILIPYADLVKQHDMAKLLRIKHASHLMAKVLAAATMDCFSPFSLFELLHPPTVGDLLRFQIRMSRSPVKSITSYFQPSRASSCPVWAVRHFVVSNVHAILTSDSIPSALSYAGRHEREIAAASGRSQLEPPQDVPLPLPGVFAAQKRVETTYGPGECQHVGRCVSCVFD